VEALAFSHAGWLRRGVGASHEPGGQPDCRGLASACGPPLGRGLASPSPTPASSHYGSVAGVRAVAPNRPPEAPCARLGHRAGAALVIGCQSGLFPTTEPAFAARIPEGAASPHDQAPPGDVAKLPLRARLPPSNGFAMETQLILRGDGRPAGDPEGALGGYFWRDSALGETQVRACSAHLGGEAIARRQPSAKRELRYVSRRSLVVGRRGPLRNASGEGVLTLASHGTSGVDEAEQMAKLATSVWCAGSPYARSRVRQMPAAGSLWCHDSLNSTRWALLWGTGPPGSRSQGRPRSCGRAEGHKRWRGHGNRAGRPVPVGPRRPGAANR